jgi:hypothetical protein
MRILTFFILGFASIVLADDFKTIAGKEYKNVTVRRVEPDGIVLNTDSGISKVYFTDLPKEVQERFHYDEAKAAAYSQQAALQARYLELQRQEDDLLLRIGQGEVGTYSGIENPLRSQLPFLHNRLDDVRHEKDKVRRELEQAQR